MTEPKFHPAFKCIIGYAAINTLFFGEALFGAVIVRRDLLKLTFPFKWLVAEFWAHGQLPLWNSASGLGMPLLADPVAGAFDPFLPLFMLPLGVYQAGTLYIWLKYLFAAIAMHRYLRVVGLSHGASFLGGSIFILSGFSIGSWTGLQWVSALMFLPLLMAAPHARGTPGGRGISAAAILSFSFWSGAVEPTLFMAVFWIVECLVHPRRDRWAEVVIGLAGFLSLSLFQFLPTLEMALLSDRQGGLAVPEALAYSVSPFQLIGLVSPISFIPPSGGLSEPGLFPFLNPLFFGTYVGAALLPLALLATGARRFPVFIVAGVALSMGRHLPGATAFLENHPVLSSLRYPVKFLYFVPPSLAILAAHGWSTLREKSLPRRAAAVGGTFLFILAIFTAGTLWPDPSLPDPIASRIWLRHLDALTYAARHALAALLAAAFLILGFDPSKKWLRPLLTAVVILDLFVAARRSLFFEHSFPLASPPLRQAIPEKWPRVLSFVRVPFISTVDPATRRAWNLMASNAGIPYHVRHVYEYGSFRMRRFNDWMRGFVVAPGADLGDLGAAGIAWFACDESLVADKRGEGWKERARYGDLALLENPRRMDEIRFYPSSTPGALDSVPDRALLRTPGGPVDFDHSQNGHLRARVPEAGWLYRAEYFYPGWKARSNGREIPVHDAEDFIGQWVYLDGPSEVTFRFEPSLFYIGLTASFVTAVLISAAGITRAFASPVPSPALPYSLSVQS